MIQRKLLQNALIGGVAVAFGSTQVIPGARERGPIATSAISIVTGGLVATDTSKANDPTAPAPHRTTRNAASFATKSSPRYSCA